MPCEPIYSKRKYALIQFGQLLGLCQDRTRDGVAWEGELRLNAYRAVAWPVMAAIGFGIWVLVKVL